MRPPILNLLEKLLVNGNRFHFRLERAHLLGWVTISLRNPMNKTSVWFVVLLAGLGVLPSLSIDMGLPALDSIAVTLHTTDAAAAMTLSLFLVGFAFAPLICGPLSDRHGRRPVLVWGTAAFALAAAGCTFAPTIEVLLFGRLIQGFGSGAVTVLSSALVRDLFEGHEARAKFAQLGVMRSFAPMIAPTIGAWILTFAHWRWIYGTLAAVGTALFMLIFFGFAESAKLNTAPLSVKALFAEYTEVFKHKVSFGYAAMNALYFGAVFTYVTNSPLLMIKHFGLTDQLFGYMFAGTAFGIMCGAFVNGKLNHFKKSPKLSLYLGLAISSTAVLSNVAITSLALDAPQTLFPGLFAFTFSAGLLAPTTNHGCVEHLPHIAGVASAVMAFLQMVMGALAGVLVSYTYDGATSWAMTLSMLFFVLTSALTYFFLVKPSEKNLHHNATTVHIIQPD